MSFKLEFDGSEERVSDFFEGFPSKLMEATQAKMSDLMNKLREKIVGEKLAGEFLNRRTGKLADSFTAPTIAQSGDNIEGDLQGAGGDAFYGAIYEKGGAGPYLIRPINKQALMFMLGGKKTFSDMLVHPAIQQRAFLASAVDDMREEFEEGIKEGIIGAFTNE